MSDLRKKVRDPKKVVEMPLIERINNNTNDTGKIICE